jgi:hypothetical protein
LLRPEGQLGIGAGRSFNKVTVFFLKGLAAFEAVHNRSPHTDLAKIFPRFKHLKVRRLKEGRSHHGSGFCKSENKLKNKIEGLNPAGQIRRPGVRQQRMC